MITNLVEARDNIKRRAGNAWVSIDGGTTWHHLGIIKAPEITWEEIVGEADNRGRLDQLGVTIKIQLVMKQTSDVEVAALPDMTNQEVSLFLGTSMEDDPASATTGYRFDKSFLNVSGSVKLDGKESNFTVKTQGDVSMTELANLVDGGTITWGK